jgi:hypothetical protein
VVPKEEKKREKKRKETINLVKFGQNSSEFESLKH